MKKIVKTTTKQSKALKLIREGVRPTVAMKKAGYSEETSSHPKQNLLRSAGAKAILEQFNEEYLRQGINVEYMVSKQKEWLEATKIQSSMTEPDRVVPDYQTQIKAGEMIRKDFGLSQENIEQNIDKAVIFQIIKDDKTN